MRPYNNSRKAILISALLLLSFGFIGCSGSDIAEFPGEFRETISEQVSAAEIEEVRVDTVNGSISVTPADVDEISIEAEKIIKAITDDEAKKHSEEVKVNITTSGKSLMVETKVPTLKAKLFRSVVNYKVTIPRGLNVYASTVNGSTTVSAGAGNLDVHATNGNITVAEAKEVDVSTVNGSINVAGCAGKHEVSSTNGAITVETGGSEARIDNVNGKIKYSASEPPQGDVTISNVNGSVEVTVPERSDLRVTASKVNGSIKSDLPLKDLTSEKKLLKGTLNEGTYDLEIETVNGFIKINGY